MKNSIQKLLEIAEPLAHTMGFEILLAEEVAQPGRRILRVYLDLPQTGISVEDCAKFSRALDPILDMEGDFKGSYALEVSSPGLNRPLVKRAHFQAQLGAIIQVRTREVIEGRRKFKGVLKSVQGEEEEGWLEMEVDGQRVCLGLSQVERANLDYFATQETYPPKQNAQED